MSPGVDLPADHGQLPRWNVSDLPAPPPFNVRNMFKVIGPGAIMAATSIGGGEWLVGPAAAVKYSSSIFLIASVAIVLQVFFNLEAIRYTLYTGEPIYGGIMRLKPGAKFWAGFYTFLGFFQLGWPALAGSAAATLFGAWMGRMPGAPDQAAQAWIASVLIVAVVLILSFGGTIERMLEYFAWTMLGIVFMFLIVVNVAFVPMSHWAQTFTGFFSLSGLSHPIDWGLIGALAATAGSGGIGNLTVTNWVRDKGFGMGSKVGAIPSAVGGHEIQLSHVGTVFPTSAENLVRWREWLRYVHADQIGVWGLFCFLGMFLNVNLATAIIPHGTDLQGLAAGAYQAEYLSKIWRGFWFLTLFNGFWILFKTQLGNSDILVRTITDAVWMSSSRARESGRGIRAIYYGILDRVLGLGRVRDPLGVALPAVQDPGEHGRDRPRDRGRPDLPREPPLPTQSRPPARMARGRPAHVFGLLRVFRVLRHQGHSQANLLKGLVLKFPGSQVLGSRTGEPGTENREPRTENLEPELLFERHPRALRLQLVQEAHDVVRRQLDEDGRHLGVEIVVQFGLEALHRRRQPLLLSVELALLDDPVRHGTRERVQLRDLLLDHRMLRPLVEPARSRHLWPPYSCEIICLIAVNRA